MDNDKLYSSRSRATPEEAHFFPLRYTFGSRYCRIGTGLYCTSNVCSAVDTSTAEWVRDYFLLCTRTVRSAFGTAEWVLGHNALQGRVAWRAPSWYITARNRFCNFLSCHVYGESPTSDTLNASFTNADGMPRRNRHAFTIGVVLADWAPQSKNSTFP